MTELDQTRTIVWVLIKRAVLKVVVRQEFMSHLLSIKIWITKAAVNKSGQKMDNVLHRRALPAVLTASNLED